MSRMTMRKAECKMLLPEEVAIGNYFYAEQLNGAAILCRIIGMKGKHPIVTAASSGKQDDYLEGLPGISCNMEDLNVVMITEDWFKANFHVFTPAPVKIYVGPEYAKLLWSYLYKSKTTPNAEYYVFGLSISYEDKDKEDELIAKGYSFLQAKEEASGRCTVVQVALKNKCMPYQPIPFMNVPSLHELQNFLAICGHPDAFAFVPEDLVDVE